jgi:hypothetical protein
MSIAALDARIAQLENSATDGSPAQKIEIVALKKQRNALTPFAGAPNEVIVRIFVNLTHKPQSPDSFFETEISSASRDWVVSMAICSRIRMIAMHAPELWSFIDGSARDEWITTCMKRAGTHSLKLFSLRMSPEADADHIQLTSSLLSNAFLADIRCDMDQQVYGTITRHWLKYTFPPLPPSLKYLGMNSDINPSPTTSFLDGKCDNLVELSLSNFALFSEHPACPRLQRLKLKRIYLSDRGYSLILEWLRSLPLLEVLFLERTGTGLHPVVEPELDSSKHRTQITMPHLRALSIKENVWTTNTLLEALPSPSQSLAVIIISKINHDDDDHNENENEDLTFPLAHNSPLTSLPQIIFTHVYRFWLKKTHESVHAIPSGRLVMNLDQMPQDVRIQFGTPPDAGYAGPSVFYDSSCDMQGPDPILETVDTLHILLSHDDDCDELDEDDEDHELEDAHGVAVELVPALELYDRKMSECGSIRHAIVEYSGDPEESRYQVMELEPWLIERKNYTGVLETLRFVGRLDEEEEAWARDLEQRELVGRILWS